MTTQHDERAELMANRIVNIAWRFRAADSMEKLQAVEAELRAALLAADAQAGGEAVACWGKRSAIDGKIYESSRSYGDGFDVPLYTHPQPQAQAAAQVAQPLKSESANRCQANLRDAGLPYPRTCEVCRLGPCRFEPKAAHGIGKDQG